MKYKITEPIVPGGLGNHRTRSCVVEIPEGQSVPAGAVPTDEEVREFRLDEAAASPTEGQ